MTSYAGEIRRLREQVGDLLASHEQTRDLAEFGKYRDDPEGFMREVLRCDPWELQSEMAILVRDNARSIAVTANGVGKDWITARIAMWWVYARRGVCILTGPTERQVKNILMSEVRRAFNATPELPGDLFSLELRVSSDSYILAFTSDSADKLVGFHHPRLLICMTEGQGMEDTAYEAAFACCTDPENRLFVYGNPTKPTGPFYRAATNGNWNRITIPASAHPNVVSGRPEIAGAVSREWIESIRQEYGAGSSMYRSRVLAEFPEESIEGLVRRDWLRAAFDRHEKGMLEHAAIGEAPVLALDVARFGPDKSVLAVVQGPIVRRLITWGGASITDSVARTASAAAELQLENERALLRSQLVYYDDRPARKPTKPTICVDEPGLGGGAIDVLRAQKFRVFAFNGASKPTERPAYGERSRFLNMRAESHWLFRKLLEDNRIALPRDPMLEEEALAVEWQINQQGLIQILGKDTLRLSLGRSPDRLDAVIIGLAYTMGELNKPAVWGTSRHNL